MQSCQGYSWRAKNILEEMSWSVALRRAQDRLENANPCKSFESKIYVFFSIMFVPESAHGVQRHKKHTTYSVPSCFCNVPSRSFKTLCGPFASGKSFWDFYPYCECSFQPCDDAMAASAPVLYPLLNGRGESQISRSKIRFFKLFKVQQLQHNLHRICTRLNVFV